MTSRDNVLTENQLAVLHLVAEGLTNDEIANRLFKSPATIKAAVRGCMIRLAVRNRTEAVLAAHRLHLLGATLVELPQPDATDDRGVASWPLVSFHPRSSPGPLGRPVQLAHFGRVSAGFAEDLAGRLLAAAALARRSS